MSEPITTYDDSRRILESNKGLYWVDNALSVHYPEYEYTAISARIKKNNFIHR